MSAYKYLLLLLCIPAYPSKVLIITHAYLRPDFIELQHKTFKKFLKDDYEFVVYNDGPTQELQQKINQMCDSLNIACYQIPLSAHRGGWASKRTSDAIQYSLEHRGFKHDGIVFIIDSDMFLIKSFNIADYMKSYDMAGLIQHPPSGNKKITYLWNGLFFVNMSTAPKRLMNFDCLPVEGEPVDTGGFMHYYLKKYSQLKLQIFENIGFNHLPKTEQELKNRGYSDAAVQLIMTGASDPYPMEFHLNDTFLHYRAGGDWMNRGPQYHQEKTKLLMQFMQSILE